MTETTFLGPDGVLSRKQKFLVPCSYHFYQKPPEIVRGSMQYLWDSSGTRYLDFFSGVSVVACGHCNPCITSMTQAQLALLQHTTSLYLTEAVVLLAERMASLLPDSNYKSFFCNSGSEANEGALLAARLYTGKKRIVSLSRSLHGRTHLGASASGLAMWRTDPFPDPACSIIPGPFDERLRRVTVEAEAASLDALSKELAQGDVAALIVEPIQGNGGIIPLSKKYLCALYETVHSASALFVADEVQTGFGRTGTMYAVNHAGVVPDIISMAKALGNGIPIAAYAARDAVAAAFTRPSASTLGGNPVSAVTALAVLDYIVQNQLCSQADTRGQYLVSALCALSSQHEGVLSPRGRGLMLGIELVDAQGNSDYVRTEKILEYAKECGLFIGKNGPDRNVLALQPPLVITQDDADLALQILEDCFSACPISL